MQTRKKAIIGLCVCGRDSPDIFAHSLATLLPELNENLLLAVYIDGPIMPSFRQLLVEVSDSPFVEIIGGICNLGLAAGLNNLLKFGGERKFDYFFRMDSDDIVISGRFERQLVFMRLNSHIDVCGTPVVEFFGEGDYKPGLEVSRRDVPKKHDQIYSGLARTATFNHPTVCFRYSSLIKWNPNLDIYDETAGLAEDYKLWVDLAEAGFKFANLPEPLLAFRITDDFYRRRSSARAFAEHKVRFDAMRRLNLYSIQNLLYAYLVLFLRFMPPKVLKLAYQAKRKLSAKK